MDEIRRRRAVDVSLPLAQCMHLREDDQEERAFRINQALEEHSYFDFPKLHLLSHYAYQIVQYGSLP